MGLLDDAIREHLELKRRAGAAPGEVAQIEREALGPVVRGELPTLPGEELDAPAEADAVEAPVADAVEPVEPVLPEEPVGEAADEAVHEAPHGDPAATLAHDVVDPAAHPDAPVSEGDHGTQPPHGDPGASLVAPSGNAQETEEYDVEAVHAADAEHTETPAGDDVLEQTPEFLQETPEHDRLWFEQGPPKDFDFDR